MLRRNGGPDVLSYILQYLLVSPLHVISHLIKFPPTDRYVISLSSDTVNIGRHPLLLLFSVSLHSVQDCDRKSIRGDVVYG